MSDLVAEKIAKAGGNRVVAAAWFIVALRRTTDYTISRSTAAKRATLLFDLDHQQRTTLLKWLRNMPHR